MEYHPPSVVYWPVVCSLCCPYVDVMDDIEQGFGQVQSDSKDLKQLQLEQTKIKVLASDIVCICVSIILLYIVSVRIYINAGLV